MPERLDEISDTLERLLDVLGEDEGLHTVLVRLAHTALWAIPDADAVSVTVTTGERPHTEATTSEDVIAIDRDQYAAGDGPCLEAARTREPVRVSVEHARERWPAFATAAEDTGVRAYLSAPLVLPVGDDGELLGALNVYSFTHDAFDPIDSSLLRLLSATAAAAIGNARRYLDCHELTEQLQKALTSRTEIDQAKGALMAIHGIDANQAFAKLVEQSQHRNTKLSEVAARFLASLRQP